MRLSRSILLLAGLAAIAAPAIAASVAGAPLTVTVTGALPQAAIYGLVFADAATFDRKADGVAGFIVPPGAGTASITLPNLPPGRYAVAVFQDTGHDGKFHAAANGFPTVPFGFSNDAAATNGPPSFDTAAFVLGPAGGSVSVPLHAGK